MHGLRWRQTIGGDDFCHGRTVQYPGFIDDCAHYCPPLNSARVIAITTTQNDSPLANLMSDSVRFGPAPTRGREVAVILTTIVLLAIILAVVQPTAVFIAIAAAAVAVSFAVRWAVGSRKWSNR